MKSFIETQRSLLTEIQKGCNHNFFLAKEKEESEQQILHSASMPEIASTEDEPGEDRPPCPGPSEQQEDEAEGVVEEEETGVASESEGGLSEGGDKGVGFGDSESETDDEDTGPGDEAQAAQRTAASSTPGETPPTPVPPPPPTSTPIESITITESPLPSPGAPPSPRRCFSVSSPGRGHKIFMVTRVESPPEQQQQQLQVGVPETQPLPEGKAPEEQPSVMPGREAQRAQEGSAGPTPTLTQESTPDVPGARAQGCHLLGNCGAAAEVCSKGEAAGAALPNGLRAEFALCLPEPEAPKAGSCVAEHGKCGQLFPTMSQRRVN